LIVFGEAAKNYTFLKIKMDTQKGWALEKVTPVSKMGFFGIYSCFFSQISMIPWRLSPIATGDFLVHEHPTWMSQEVRINPDICIPFSK